MAPQPGPGPAYGYGVPSPKKTNGLAIASLVLSILWLGGLGSVLAVIFGVSGERTIRKSQGRQTGRGLAIAGLVIGIVGILGAVGFYGLVIAVDHTANVITGAVHEATTPHVVPFDRSIRVPSADLPGVASVTVYSLSYPVRDSSGQRDQTPGKEYAAVDVRECAGPSGSQNGPDLLSFELLFPDGDSVGVLGIGTSKGPNLDRVDGFGDNQCVRGYVTFEIAKGTFPNAVQYLADPFHIYQWTAPAR